MMPEGVKTEVSDGVVTQNFADIHLRIGIQALLKLKTNDVTVKHLKF